MIISLTRNHPATKQLEDLSIQLRAQHRKETTDIPDALARAVNLTEVNYGSGTATFMFLPGSATSDDAIASYQYIRRFYPEILEILCHSAARNAKEITVEIGATNQQDEINYSQHDLLRIMPRILALFRGTVGKD